MANQEHLEVVRQGADAINEWRKEHLGEHLDLRRADLRRPDLREANLRQADLRWADLWQADLWQASLRQASLRQANLRGVSLRQADLRGADLWQADLRQADLRQADLWQADLREADLQGARFNWYSRELISEWLRQDAGNNPLRLGIVGVAGYSDMCWRDCIRAIRNSPLREEIPWARARITLARRNERRE